MKIGRRAFLGGMAAAPVLAPHAARDVASRSWAGLSLGLPEPSAWTHPVPSSPTDWLTNAARQAGVGIDVWKALNNRYDEAQKQFNASFMYRDGAFQNDIINMRSWSNSFKARAQQTRDNERLKEIEDMRLKLWPRTDE